MQPKWMWCQTYTHTQQYWLLHFAMTILWESFWFYGFLIRSSADQSLKKKHFFKWHGIHQHRVHVERQVERKNYINTFFFVLCIYLESQSFGRFVCFFPCYRISWLGCDIIRCWCFFLFYPDLRLFVMICMRCKMLDWALTECVVSVFLSISLFVVWCRYFITFFLLLMMFFAWVCVNFSFISNVWDFQRFICRRERTVNGALKSALKMRH